MKSTLEILIDARALIATDWWAGWGRSHISDGNHCLSIALGNAGDIGTLGLYPDLSRAFDRLMVLAGTKFLPLFNDTHDHAEVLALVDHAIAAERAASLPRTDAAVKTIIETAIAGAEQRGELVTVD